MSLPPQSRDSIATSMTPSEGEQRCPQCQTNLPIYQGYTTWCHNCNWNIEIQGLPPVESPFAKLYRTLSSKSSKSLYENMLAQKPELQRISYSKVLALLLALPVHLVTFSFVLLAMFLSYYAWPAWTGFFLAILCLLVAWALSPQMPSLDIQTVSRLDFPMLYKIADQIAAQLGAPQVDEMAITVDFRASYGRYGYRRKQVICLGLPLLSVLDSNEKIALISHELAHSVNGDVGRGLFITSAISSLDTWYQLLRRNERIWIPGVMGLFYIAVLPLVGIVWLWLYALVHLLWRDSQRCEYLADYLAAKVSGTKAMLATLDKSSLRHVFENTLLWAYTQRDGLHFFEKLRFWVNKAPARELQRIHRVEQLSQLRIDTTHPPTAYRRQFLITHAIETPGYTLSVSDVEKLESELQRLRSLMQEWVFKLDEITFREMFKTNW